MKTLEDIKEGVTTAVKEADSADFIYALLRAYRLPKASVTRLETGDYNLSKTDGEILWKKRLFFAHSDGDRLRTAVDEAAGRTDVQRHEPRFAVVTDMERIVARDLKTNDTLDVPLEKLGTRYEFFLPWAGIEKTQVFTENPADVKAAEKMAGLYDHILDANPDAAEASHHLNVFFARILFCLFAEDTGIFEKGIFTTTLEQVTDQRGDNVQAFLGELFSALNTDDRGGEQPFYLRDFPYVNGGLFAEEIDIPRFSGKARRVLIECGSELDWSEINPDIFGSMVQAVVREDQRENLGIHYTSVPNIMKVIGPLFLDELRSDFEGAKGSRKKLQQLWARISEIKFFDPACGSGNFLIITYKEIRKLEMEIIAALEALAGGQGEIYLSRISLNQCYGIEIDDFAHEVAMLSLWLAEHQMNVVFQERFGRVQPYLPLKHTGHIVHGNAARLPWDDVCGAGDDTEVYLMGNPPYLGSSMQSKVQKEDMKRVFDGRGNYKNLDYIAIWFLKGAQYVKKSLAEVALVTTNSICQGDSVGLLWPHIFQREVEIGFAHPSFRWSNSARGKAAVHVAIVGLRNQSESPRKIFRDGKVEVVQNISPYLTAGADTVVSRVNSPLSDLPRMEFGNKPTCGGNLVMSVEEGDRIVDLYPGAEPFVRPFYGAHDYLHDQPRRCLWIEDADVEKALSYPPIRERVDRVAAFRARSKAESTRDWAKRPHSFRQTNCQGEGVVLIVPRHSSERREYIPVGHLPPGTVVGDSANGVFSDGYWLFGLLSSAAHMTWVRAVAGRIKSDYRYSSTICYNTFPFPEVSESRKAILNAAAKQVIVAREQHSERTLADLYDPDEMPDDLREAHAELDRAVDRCYRSKPFASDEERLQLLFEMYEDLTKTNAS